MADEQVTHAGGRWITGPHGQVVATRAPSYPSMHRGLAYVQSVAERWARDVVLGLLGSRNKLDNYTRALLPPRDKLDIQLYAQIAAVDVAAATRARARELVEQFVSRGLRVNRACESPEGGITLHATGSCPGCYASIDVDDDQDVVIGVSDANQSRIVNTCDDLDAALDEVATFLSRT